MSVGWFVRMGNASRSLRVNSWRQKGPAFSFHILLLSQPDCFFCVATSYGGEIRIFALCYVRIYWMSNRGKVCRPRRWNSACGLGKFSSESVADWHKVRILSSILLEIVSFFAGYISVHICYLFVFFMYFYLRFLSASS
jgi:hypothetical protein